VLPLLPILALSALATSQSLTADGMTVTYDTALYAKAEIYEAKAKPAPETPDYEVSPAYLDFCFNCGPSPKRAPQRGSISVIPLLDRSVKDLSQPYPDLLKDVAALRRLLHDRPKLVGKDVRKGDGLPTVTNRTRARYS
jgi:hypothetical protein